MWTYLVQALNHTHTHTHIGGSPHLRHTFTNRQYLPQHRRVIFIHFYHMVDMNFLLQWGDLYILIGDLEHLDYFSIQLGISIKSQLMNSYFLAQAQPPTRRMFQQTPPSPQLCQVTSTFVEKALKLAQPDIDLLVVEQQFLGKTWRDFAEQRVVVGIQRDATQVFFEESISRQLSGNTGMF